MLLATTVVGCCIFASFSVLHMLFFERWTDWLYYEKKILKRRQPLGKRISYTSPVDTVVLAFFPVLLRANGIFTNTTDFTFKPLDILASNLIVYLSFDTVYYFAHRILHESPFLYRTIHKRHHDSLPVHVFLTAKAHILENVIAVSPAMILWNFITMTFITKGVFNFWTIMLPNLTMIMEFNTAHAGYLDHWTMYVVSPLQCIKILPFARRVAAEHENHHLMVTKNYAPMFRHFDLLGGTHEGPAVEKYQTADVIEQTFKPRKAKSN
ncbi:hypothetical protein DFJ73DRAFT_967229 [Zopfochytrium polystomum]|nr:hypothetical protein DFJ73DRAFT_967229 [Zopfochytrium polystomum]